jgi:hypothetical protein
MTLPVNMLVLVLPCFHIRLIFHTGKLFVLQTFFILLIINWNSQRTLGTLAA